MRDLYKRYLNPTASHGTQKLFGRLGVAFIVLSALMVATFSADALVLLGGLAVAFGFQMWPSLAPICWIPWITRQGATLGLAAGLICVIVTETFGRTIAGWVGIDLPWGRWPWTLPSAGWGILLNIGVCVIVSAVTDRSLSKIEFPRFYGRRPWADFGGRGITSNGGALLLSAADRRHDDARQAGKVDHRRLALLRQRVYAVAPGHEDVNDHAGSRDDLAPRTAVG